MQLKKYVLPPLATNCYLIGDSQLTVIDPALGSAVKILQQLAELSRPIDKILLTHSHFDHVADLKKLHEKTGAPIYIHEKDAGNLERPGSDGVPQLIEVEPVIPQYFLAHGDSLTIDGVEVEVLHTPGQSPGGLCFFLPTEKWLFSGDTLFKKTMGAISFPTSNVNDMCQSLRKLAKLPKDTTVWPGHGPPTSIGEEPWLQEPEKLLF